DRLGRFLGGRQVARRAADPPRARRHQRREAEQGRGHDAQGNHCLDQREAAIVLGHARIHSAPVQRYARIRPVAPRIVIARTERAPPPRTARKTVPLIVRPRSSTSVPSLLKRTVSAAPKSMGPALPNASGVSGTPGVSAYTTLPSNTTDDSI